MSQPCHARSSRRAPRICCFGRERLSTVAYERGCKRYVLHVFVRPVSSPAHRIELRDGQRNLTFLSVPELYQVAEASGEPTLPSFLPVVQLLDQFNADGLMEPCSGICVGCGRLAVASSGCSECGAPCDATDNTEHFFMTGFAPGGRL